jgi:hypothetical protein
VGAIRGQLGLANVNATRQAPALAGIGASEDAGG